MSGTFVLDANQPGPRNKRSRLQPDQKTNQSPTFLLIISEICAARDKQEQQISQIVAFKMRLIDIRTYELHEFIGSQIPPYAILSHRWGDEELTYKEVAKRRIHKTKRGYRKLHGACRISARYDVRYLWIDTCCIDKRSSAELSEAINSMFAWYKNSEVCLAYLGDVESDGANDQDAFQKSVWFTRCWTLQELLAPKQVDFFDAKWNFMGQKETRWEEIEDITGISSRILSSESYIQNIREASIVEKMSWASDRHATRSEDIAYSLMGLFNINMPLLYGEGDNAFVRLQEEIIRSTDDISFLHWRSRDLERGFFAKSPANFSLARMRGLEHYMVGDRIRQVFGLNNLGLEIETQFLRYAPNVYGIILARHNSWSVTAALLVKKCHAEGYYHRIGVIDVLEKLFFLWTEKRKGTVLRDTAQICCQKPVDINMVSSMSSTTGIMVHVDEDKSAPSITLDRTRSTFYESGGNSRSGDEVLNRPMCKFSSRLPETLRTSWHIIGGPDLWLDICFDFDSYPCVLLHQQMNGDEPDQGAVQIAADEHRSEGWNFDDSDMLRIGGHSESAVSFFYRSRASSDKAIEIPSELSGPRKQLAIQISLLLTSSNPFSSWRMRVVDAPMDIENLALYQ